MKLLYIAPHLSTGGLPQYLFKKIEMLVKKNISILVVEYSDLGGDAFIVQKERIRNLVPIKTLYDDKREIISVIEDFKPDVIHFEELPEYFMDRAIAMEIYGSDKKYKLIETTHDSSFDVENKIFIPDEFLFVSDYSIQQFSKLGVPSKLVEYPIEIQERPARKTALESLGLDPSKIHILNVGLFTPRKNQKEIAEYAKELLHLPVQFHFVGNQAGNFEFYWKPIMDNLPENCVVWGERKDTDAFYSSMDLFLFTSKGTVHDKETNPLSLKEALAWDMDILMYNLPVYLNKYDYVPNVSYLTQDIAQNIAMIGKFINFNRED
jgi:glycosyltransferase involved in cell wall biosynthesis